MSIGDHTEDGREALATCIEQAQPYPVKSLYHAETFGERVLSLYRHSRQRGLSTGWSSLDSLYTVAPVQLTIVTDVPNAGKIRMG
jgi:twinkle protein